jgi:ABC-type transporter Mla subunit MlaD
MALQDLTPQLRTRLNRMERAVGVFVFLATALLVFGFGYYLYQTATRKGWFIPRAPYFTFTDRATGLKVGDPVVLMGFEVGQITRIDTMEAWSEYNVYVEFEIKEPYNGYLWAGRRGSRAEVATSDLFGKRVLEVTKGFDGYPAYSFHPLKEVSLEQARAESRPERWRFASEYYDATQTNRLIKILETVTQTNLETLGALGVEKISVFETNEIHKTPTVVWDDKLGGYTNFIPRNIPERKLEANLYWLLSDETPAITERLTAIVDRIQKALPEILQLPGQIAGVLSNISSLTSNLNLVALDAQPVVSNLTHLTAQLRSPGSLGDWMLGPTGRLHAESVLGNANLAIAHADTNFTATLESLARSLDEVAGITSNLHAQVQANTNILSSISKAVMDADELVQGLKKHWLLRSAFKAKPEADANPETQDDPKRLRSPRDSP